MKYPPQLVRRIAVISIIIIMSMAAIQFYGVTITRTAVQFIYPTYTIDEIIPNNVPEGIFVLEGNYSTISTWINATKYPQCKDTTSTFLAVSREEHGFDIVYIIDLIKC